MGRTSSKEVNILYESNTQKHKRQQQQQLPQQMQQQQQQQQQQRQEQNQPLYDPGSIVPVRHQWVLADRVSPVSSLSAVIHFATARRRSCIAPSLSDDDKNEPSTPALSMSSIVYDASVHSLASSPSWPISPMAASAVASVEQQMKMKSTKENHHWEYELNEDKERER
ncbi:hypothetical protein EC973_003125 [Apophysomyces ossiformis]|uniref:Uncharacterized protein n=1 Tax=Apophysomyces ossiformis TaxID=679940 RepID=A0A8H7BLS7_9FUNG|nr:hypothetical protein EC973_003125 [Apophysomyces ossiformis]